MVKNRFRVSGDRVVLLLLTAISWWSAFQDNAVSPYIWSAVLPAIIPACVLVSCIISTVRRQCSKGSMAVYVLCLWPVVWNVDVGLIAYPGRAHSGGVIQSPFRVNARVAWGGDGLGENYHAATPAQRWAYDLVVEPAFHGDTALESYGCWGQAVSAPLAGRVVAVRDGKPDAVPGVLPALSLQAQLDDRLAALGNAVVIETTEGYLVMAHLRQGSVTVTVGQEVTEETQVGACGNSGHSSEPHLHLHYQRQSPEKQGVILANPLPLYVWHEGNKMLLKGGLTRDGQLQGDTLAAP